MALGLLDLSTDMVFRKAHLTYWHRVTSCWIYHQLLVNPAAYNGYHNPSSPRIFRPNHWSNYFVWENSIFL